MSPSRPGFLPSKSVWRTHPGVFLEFPQRESIVSIFAFRAMRRNLGVYTVKITVPLLLNNNLWCTFYDKKNLINRNG